MHVPIIYILYIYILYIYIYILYYIILYYIIYIYIRVPVLNCHNHVPYGTYVLAFG